MTVLRAATDIAAAIGDSGSRLVKTRPIIWQCFGSISSSLTNSLDPANK